jgi:hypothetical protein
MASNPQWIGERKNFATESNKTWLEYIRIDHLLQEGADWNICPPSGNQAGANG